LGWLDELRTKGFPTEQTVLGVSRRGCLMAIEVGLRYLIGSLASWDQRLRVATETLVQGTFTRGFAATPAS